MKRRNIILALMIIVLMSSMAGLVPTLESSILTPELDLAPNEFNPSAGAEWLEGWTYRKANTITGTAGAGTNYQIRVDTYYDEMSTDYFVDFGIHLPLYGSQQAVYLNDITYVVFQGTLDSDPYAIYYNHTSDTWSDYVKIADNPLTDDDHGCPSLSIDFFGYLHIWYGCHVTTLKHAKSDNPEDISAWTVQADVVSVATYPKPVQDGNDTYVFYREYTSSTWGNWVYKKSTDNGATWGAETIFLNIGDNKAAYLLSGSIDIQNDKIHLGWNYHSYVSGKRENTYYAYFNVIDAHMYSVEDTDLGTYVDLAESNSDCLVKDSAGEWAHQPTIHVDSNDIPYVIWDEDGGGYVDWKIYFSYWNGTAWETEVITTDTDSNAYNDFIVHSSTNIEAYLVTTGVESDPYGDIERWSWNGASWSKYSTILTEAESGHALTFPIVPLDYNPEFKVMFCQRIYDYGAANSTIYAHDGENFVTKAFSDFGVSMEGNCQSDFDDIRFTEDDGSTELDYWCESNVTSTSAIFWVEVTDNLDSNQLIYLYYGNSTVDTTSNGTNTFLEFSHWLVIPVTNTGIGTFWIAFDTNLAATDYGTAGSWHGPQTDRTEYAYSEQTSGLRARSAMYFDSTTGDTYMGKTTWRLWDGATEQLQFLIQDGWTSSKAGRLELWDKVGGDTSLYEGNQFDYVDWDGVVEIDIYENSETDWWMYADDSLLGSGDHDEDWTFNQICIALEAYDTQPVSQQWIDWTFIAKFVYYEPAPSWGVEVQYSANPVVLWSDSSPDDPYSNENITLIALVEDDLDIIENVWFHALTFPVGFSGGDYEASELQDYIYSYSFSSLVAGYYAFQAIAYDRGFNSTLNKDSVIVFTVREIVEAELIITTWDINWYSAYVTLSYTTNWANTTAKLYIDTVYDSEASEPDVMLYTLPTSPDTYNITFLIDGGVQSISRQYNYTVAAPAADANLTISYWDIAWLSYTVTINYQTNWKNTTCKLYVDTVYDSEGSEPDTLSYTLPTTPNSYNLTWLIDGGGQSISKQYNYTVVAPNRIEITTYTFFGASSDFTYMQYSGYITHDCTFNISEWSDSYALNETHTGSVTGGTMFNIAWDKIGVNDVNANFTIVFVSGDLSLTIDGFYGTPYKLLQVIEIDVDNTEESQALTNITINFYTNKDVDWYVYDRDDGDAVLVSGSSLEGSDYLTWVKNRILHAHYYAVKWTDGVTNIWYNSSYWTFRENIDSIDQPGTDWSERDWRRTMEFWTTVGGIISVVAIVLIGASHYGLKKEMKAFQLPHYETQEDKPK